MKKYLGQSMEQSHNQDRVFPGSLLQGWLTCSDIALVAGSALYAL